jgi:hypothetical protein
VIPIDAVRIEVGGTPFTFPRSIEGSVAQVLKGKYDFGVLPDAPKVRRILDLGASVGDFACWAWFRWRNSWIDCYEPDRELRAFLMGNLPPGAAAYRTAVRDATAASLLPPCDLLKLDVGGGEAEVLRGYQHRPSIVSFDWHLDQDRLDIEKTLASWGLRCFKIIFKNPDLGHETWVRSRAVWNEKERAYALP